MVHDPDAGGRVWKSPASHTADGGQMDRLEERIKVHEGYRDKPYQDSLGNWTIGYGHLMSNGMDDDVLELQFSWDFYRAKMGVKKLVLEHPELAELPRSITEVLIELVFNMGLGKVRGFKRMIGYLCVKNYERAAAELLDSRWAKQVGPHRSTTLANIIKRGEL